MNDVTRILSAIEQGDPQAAEQLLPLVYDELRKLAAQRLAQEKPGQTLQATALVHEAYLRLVGRRGGPALGQPRPLLRRRGRGHAPHPRRQRPPQAAPEARRRPAPRRPRRRRASPIDAAGRGPAGPGRGPDEAGRRGPGTAELVKLRFFAGLTIERGRRGPRHLAARPPTATGPTPGPGCASELGERATGRRTSENISGPRGAIRRGFSHWHVGRARTRPRSGR